METLKKPPYLPGQFVISIEDLSDVLDLVENVATQHGTLSNPLTPRQAIEELKAATLFIRKMRGEAARHLYPNGLPQSNG